MINNSCMLQAPISLACRQDEKNNINQEYRTMFMRDRDRILYSKAFRKLAEKTQVYLFGTSDQCRTRLTHTLEVAQIAGTISRGLGLNLELTEAIAFGHDIGHTPFGHAGEQILHEIMVPCEKNDEIVHGSPMGYPDIQDLVSNSFGFKHNLQGVRTAVSLERSYGKYGLDLTNYTLWGIQKHSSYAYKKGRVSTQWLEPSIYKEYEKYYLCKGGTGLAWSFEAFVVREADEIAQRHHDMEDAVRSKAISRKEVCTIMKDNLSSIMDEHDKHQLNKMLKDPSSFTEELFVTHLSRLVVNTLVNRLISNSQCNLKNLIKNLCISIQDIPYFFANTSPDDRDIRSMISYSNDDNTNISSDLERFGSQIEMRVLHSYDVQRMDIKGKYIIRKLFQAYYKNPQQLPDQSIIQFLVAIERYKSVESAQDVLVRKGMGFIRKSFDSIYNYTNVIHQVKLMRVICDHIASLTDSNAIGEYQALYG